MAKSFTYPNVYIPYIKLKLDNGLSLVWRYNEQGLPKSSHGGPDYFNSLTHNRVVSKANTADITIAYTPQKGEDPNKIEEAIAASGGQCEFEYGLAGRTSSCYKGLIYSYNVDIQEGTLVISMRIVSKSVLWNYEMISNNMYNIRKAGSTSSYIEETSQIPPIGPIEYQDYLSYIQNKIIKDLPPDVDEVLWTMNKIVKDFMGDDYEFDTERSSKSFKVKEDLGTENTLIDVKGLTPVKALQTIARLLLPKDGDPQGTFYKIVIEDKVNNGTKGKIYLREYSDNKKEVALYKFEWGTKNTTVLSWNPKYDGAVSIFRLRGEVQGSSTSVNDNEIIAASQQIIYNATTDAAGNVTLTGLTAPRALKGKIENYDWLSTASPDQFKKVILENTNWFNEMANYCYLADLTVLGLPDDELQIGYSKVRVEPYINGKLHHSAGVYIVTSIKDSVSAEGFTTTLGLYKNIKSEYETKVKTAEEPQDYKPAGVAPISAPTSESTPKTYNIVSPGKGYIYGLNVVSGSTIKSGQQLCTIVSDLPPDPEEPFSSITSSYDGLLTYAVSENSFVEKGTLLFTITGTS